MNLILNFFIMVTVGIIIGWFTNYLAIKLLFRPYKEIRLPFYKIQGLIPKNRERISLNIAEVIEKELISADFVADKLKNSNMNEEEMIDRLVDKVVDQKLENGILEKAPLLKMVINKNFMNMIKNYFKKAILENKDQIINELAKAAKENIDFKEIMLEKMNAFSLEETEKIILSVSKNELKSIEIIGGILGGFIAALQFLLMLILKQI